MRRFFPKLLAVVLFVLAFGTGLRFAHKAEGTRRVMTVQDITAPFRPATPSSIEPDEAQAGPAIYGGSSGSGVPAGCSLTPTGKLQCNLFVSTFNGTGSVSDGGANFTCSGNPAQSSPCFANFTHPMEVGGFFSTPSDATTADIYLGAMQDRDGGPIVSVLNNYGIPGGGTEKHTLDSFWNGDLFIGGSLYLDESVSGSLSGTGRVWSRQAPMYLISAGAFTVWQNTGSGDVANFFADPGGTQVFDIQHDGALKAYSAKSAGNTSLSGGTKAITVRSGAVCVCSTSTVNAVRCSVSATTLTITGTGTDAVSYLCM